MNERHDIVSMNTAHDAAVTRANAKRKQNGRKLGLDTCDYFAGTCTCNAYFSHRHKSKIQKQFADPTGATTQAVGDGRDRPALILIPMVCCVPWWTSLGGQNGLGTVTWPHWQNASSLARLFFFSHVFTGPRALGRRA